MSKRITISVFVIILAGLGATFFLSREEKPPNMAAFSEEDLSKRRAQIAADAGQPDAPSQVILVPLDLSHPVRLAIGGLGLADNDKNQQLGDLVTTELTGTPGFNLVERQSLATILQELNLSLHSFVRAKDAVRVGKLLKADWFLLGTEAKINGTNSLVVRVVDARTGVMRDAGVFPADKPPVQLAAALAAFMRQTRQNAATAKLRVYLAVGAFEDLSVNNRQADFPTQLRGYLTAAYRGSSVTLLEREYVDTLLQEMRLDLAGLTEESESNLPPAMQSAFWLVTGQYQSYETTNLQVELNLHVWRVFGRSTQFTLRGLPGESVGQQAKAAIDDVMLKNPGSFSPTRRSEAHIQMKIGKELGGLKDDIMGLVWISGNWDMDSQVAAKEKRNLEEAMRAFEAALLLEPTNRLAKMYLAACLRKPANYHLEEARNYYREIIEEPVQDKWSELAQKALLVTFESYWWQGPEPGEKGKWFQSAANQTSNAVAAAFYNKQAQAAADEVTMNAGDSPSPNRGACRAATFCSHAILPGRSSK